MKNSAEDKRQSFFAGKLQLMIFRAAFFKNGIIFEITQLQDLGGQIQVGTHILRLMGIGPHSDDLTTKLVIAAQDIGTGMGLPETVAEASGV